MKPITPQEVTHNIPDEVIASFNELIQENFDGRTSTIKQDQVIERILSKLPDIPRQTIFDKNWLDVENKFKEVGWKVEYEKPSWGEDWKAFFRFSI